MTTSTVPFIVPGRTVGPFTLSEQIGIGGMGAVYRAHHRATGDIVALKLVREPQQSNLAGLRREIGLLQTLRHPGVIRIVDAGTQDGTPWLAMELLEGQTMGELLATTPHDLPQNTASTLIVPAGALPNPNLAMRAALPDGGNFTRKRPQRQRPLPDNFSFLLTLIRRVCETLAFLHGDGVVHRDLKPENIFVRRDGSPVLMDFGLMRRYCSGQRDVIDVPATPAGTLGYMAPEQLRGDRVDARADLFSLGCILFRAIAGHAAFEARSMDELLWLHSFEEPPRLSMSVSEVPPALDEMVTRLLTIRPGDRLGHASDVAGALAQLGAAGWHLPEVRTRVNLYRPRFTGREKTIGAIRRYLETGTDRAAGCLAILGDSGIGKTALLAEAARTATDLGSFVVVGNCLPVGLGSENDTQPVAPLQPLAKVLQSIADLHLSGDTDLAHQLVGDDIKVLAPYEPSLLGLPGAELLREPGALDGQPARLRLFGALARALAILARRHPLTLILDDVHWADELTLDFLAWLPSSFFRDNRAAIIVSLRAEETVAQIEALKSASHCQTIVLPRLDDHAVAHIICDMLAVSDPPSFLVTFLVSSAAGNPFFVAEYLRAAVGDNLLSRGANGRWLATDAADAIDSLPLPGSLRELVTRRFHALSEPARQLLQVAAIIGRDIPLKILGDAARRLNFENGSDDVELFRFVKELVSRQILEEDSESSLRFVHDKLREIAYDLTPDDRRRALHEVVAECLERAHGVTPRHPRRMTDTSETTALWSTLADHWRRAGHHQAAFRYFRLAGDSARLMFSNEAAIAYLSAAREEFERAAPSIGEVELAEVLESLGGVLAIGGRYVDARAAYASALPHALSKITRARLRRKEGKTWAAQHEHVTALRTYAEAEQELGPTPQRHRDTKRWWREWIDLCSDEMWACYWLNRLPQLNDLVERVLPAVTAHGGPSQRARYYECLTALSIRGERYRLSGTTLRHARFALSAAKRAGRAGELNSAHFGFAFSLLFSGHTRKAASQLASGLASADRLGDVPLILRYLTYLGIAERMLHRRGSVEQKASRLSQLAQQGPALDYLGSAAAQLSWVAWERGDGPAAWAQIDLALKWWAQCPIVHPFQWTARWQAVALSVAAGEPARALEHASALLAPTQQPPPIEVANHLVTAVAAAEKAEDPMPHLRKGLALAKTHRLL